MNMEQKIAWFTVVLATATLLTFSALLIWQGLSVALAAFAIMSAYGFTPLFYRKRGDERSVLTDERDRLIARQANVVGGMFSYLVFIFSCMAIWMSAYYQGKESVGISLLPMIVLFGGLALLLARSIALLLLYHRDSAYGEG